MPPAELLSARNCLQTGVWQIGQGSFHFRTRRLHSRVPAGRNIKLRGYASIQQLFGLESDRHSEQSDRLEIRCE